MNQCQFDIGRLKSGVNYFRDPKSHGFLVLFGSPSSQQKYELALCGNLKRKGQYIVIVTIGNAFVAENGMNGVIPQGVFGLLNAPGGVDIQWEPVQNPQEVTFHLQAAGDNHEVEFPDH